MKPFLFAGRLKVAKYPTTEHKEPVISREPVYIVGAAACDVESLRSLDAVFLQEEFTDIFYRDPIDAALGVDIFKIVLRTPTAG